MRKLFSRWKYFLLVPLLLFSLFSITSCASTVSVSESNISMYVDDTAMLTASSSDEDALVLWESSDKTVATVRRGKVTAVGKGECDITAYDDNGARASCHVSVAQMGVTISHASKKVDLARLNTFLLHAESEDNGEIAWTSSDEKIARVDSLGQVTCYDTGDVMINAYRKGGKASCIVTVTDSERGEDYYIMNAGQNAVVAANPGVWYYWLNGGSKISKAAYQNNGFTSSITALDGNGVFYRYQPGGEDGTGLMEGDRYKITFDVKLNVTGSIRGKKTVSVKADEWTSYSYSGTIASSEPFYFSVRDMAIPSSGAITVAVRNIKVAADRGGDYYDIVAGKNAEVVASPGKWFYWANGSDKVKKAYYENKQVHISIEKLSDEAGMYFRYQPGGSGSGISVGDEYTISLNITMNITGKFTGKSTAEVTTPGTFVKYEYSGTVDASNPFQITLKGVTVPTGGTIDVTMKDISVVKKGGVVPPEDYYEVLKGNNATCVASPGRWFYWTNGSDTVASAAYADGTVSISIDKLENSQGIYFRYQPGNDGTGLEVGDKYTITLMATMNIAGELTGKSSATITTPGTFVKYQYTGTVLANEPFYITLKGVTVPQGGTIDVTLKDIIVQKGEPEPGPGPTPTVSYEIAKGNNASVVASPGKWFYWTNGDDVVDSATYEDGVVTASISKLENAQGIFFRYQPGGDDGTGLQVGDEYEISLQVTMNIAGELTGKSSATVSEPGAFVEYTYEGTVLENEPFYITVKDVTVPEGGTIDVTFKDIVIKKIGGTTPSESYEILKGNNATCVANPGKWYYWTNGSDAVSSAQYEDGVVSVSINKLENSQGMYIRYQPGGEDGTGLQVGDQYTITMQVTMSVAGDLLGRSSATVSEPGTFVEYAYTGAVLSNEPFFVTVKGFTVPEGGTIDVTLKDIVVKKVVPEPGPGPTPTVSYDIEKGTNAAVLANPGKWYYWTNGEDVVDSATYEDGVVTASISKLDSDLGMYFRYQPGGDDGTGLQVGDEYEISMQVTMNVSGSFTGPGTATIATPGTFVEYKAEGTVSEDSPFQITLKDVAVPEGTLDVTFKDIVITKKSGSTEPPEPSVAYEVLKGNNATCVANPGKWYYWTNGSDTVSSAQYQDGVVSVSITKLENEQGMYVRYQPGGDDGTGLEVGDQYHISFKITMNVPGNVTGKSSATVSEAGVFVDYSYTGTVNASSPFNFTVKGIAIPESGSIDVTFKDIVIEKVS